MLIQYWLTDWMNEPASISMQGYTFYNSKNLENQIITHGHRMTHHEPYYSRSHCQLMALHLVYGITLSH